MAKPSPCIKQCKVVEGALCRGCLRTIDEIVRWGSMPVSDCLAVMNKIKGKNNTHNCPQCGEPTYCAMEAGKSFNTCWCMTLPHEVTPLNDYEGDSCICRSCLQKTLDKEVSPPLFTGIKDASR